MINNRFSAATSEVIDFFGSGQILAAPDPNRVIGFTLIDGFSNAKTLAFETTYGANELTWADIRSERMAEVWKIMYSTPEYQELDQQLLAIVAMVEKGIKKNLGSTAFREILDDVASDFRGCLYSRAFPCGKTRFFESVFDVYKAGCWPCGWTGMYPDGELVAFRP